MCLSVCLSVSEILESRDYLIICEYGLRPLYSRCCSRHHLHYDKPDRLCLSGFYQTLNKFTNIQNVIMKRSLKRITLKLRTKGQVGFSHVKTLENSIPGKGAKLVKAQLLEGAEGI